MKLGYHCAFESGGLAHYASAQSAALRALGIQVVSPESEIHAVSPLLSSKGRIGRALRSLTSELAQKKTLAKQTKELHLQLGQWIDDQSPDAVAEAMKLHPLRTYKQTGNNTAKIIPGSVTQRLFIAR
jgi:hypothetical protein